MHLLCLAGDGIGPEIMAATRQVLEAALPKAKARLTFSQADIGFAALDACGVTLPEAVLDQARAADGIILGPVSHNSYPPVAQGGLNPSGVLRKELDLFANVRPARTWNGVPHLAAGSFSLTVMRENLEGFYADRNMHLGPGEFMPDPDTALALRKITRAGSMRIAQAAFDHAIQNKQQRVTAIHKANVMRVSDGLFLECCRRVAETHPGIRYDEMLVDAAAAHLVRDPAQFGTLVTTNMFGDILSDLASELSGGLGLAASLNFGTRHVVAQAQHGSAPDLAGQDIANPTSLILSAAMLMRHLGQDHAADAIDSALARVLEIAHTRTRDLGGALSTRAFADILCKTIEKAA